MTIINGQGAFTGSDRKILLCAVRHREFASLKNIVFETDEKAFLTSAVSDGIFGEGFFRKQLF